MVRRKRGQHHRRHELTPERTRSTRERTTSEALNISTTESARSFIEQIEEREDQERLRVAAAAIDALLSTPPMLWFQEYRRTDDMSNADVRTKRELSRRGTFDHYSDMDHGRSDILLQLRLLVEGSAVADDPAQLSGWQKKRYINKDAFPAALDRFTEIMKQQFGESIDEQRFQEILSGIDGETITRLLLQAFPDRIYFSRMNTPDVVAAQRPLIPGEERSDDERVVTEARLTHQGVQRGDRLKRYTRISSQQPRSYDEGVAIAPLSIAGDGQSYPPAIFALTQREGRGMRVGTESTRQYVSMVHPISGGAAVRSFQEHPPTYSGLRFRPGSPEYDAPSDGYVATHRLMSVRGERIAEDTQPIEAPEEHRVEIFAGWLAQKGESESERLPTKIERAVNDNPKTLADWHRYYAVTQHQILEPPKSLYWWYKDRLEANGGASSIVDLQLLDGADFRMQFDEHISADEQKRLDNQFPARISIGESDIGVRYAFTPESDATQGDPDSPFTQQAGLAVTTETILDPYGEWVANLPDEPDQWTVGEPEQEIPVELVVTMKAPVVVEQSKGLKYHRLKDTTMRATTVAQLKQKRQENMENIDKWKRGELGHS